MLVKTWKTIEASAKSEEPPSIVHQDLSTTDSVIRDLLTPDISKVLYPNDTSVLGKELRLKQQYFFVSASIQDILRRFLSTNVMKKQEDWKILPEKIAIQLNDTHPSIGVAEMMYQLVDVHHLTWDFAWQLVTKIFAYTNHTLMPEALETWSVDLFGELLPRHLEIIYKINHEFLHMVNHHFPGDVDLLNLSLIHI